jgi:hypothetical protein
MILCALFSAHTIEHSPAYTADSFARPLDLLPHPPYSMRCFGLLFSACRRRHHVRFSPHIPSSIRLLTRLLYILDAVIASVSWRKGPLLPAVTCPLIHGRWSDLYISPHSRPCTRLPYRLDIAPRDRRFSQIDRVKAYSAPGSSTDHNSIWTAHMRIMVSTPMSHPFRWAKLKNANHRLRGRDGI